MCFLTAPTWQGNLFGAVRLRPRNRMWQNESLWTDVGTKHLAALGPAGPAIRDWFPQLMPPLDRVPAPGGQSRAMKIRMFFSFPLTLHAFHERSPPSLGKSVSLWDLSSALLLWAYQGKDPFNFQKPCLSINCFCSVLGRALPPSPQSRHSLCTGSISHYLSWPLVQSSFHSLLGLFLSWFALPQPHSVIGGNLLSTWCCIPGICPLL